MKNHSTKAQFIRYFITGVGSTIIDTTVFTILTYGLRINYLIANFFAFMAGFTLAYPANVKWVFKSSKQKNKAFEIFLFLLFSVLALAIEQFALFTLVDFFHLNKLLAKFLAIGTVVVWNFITRKVFIFN